MDRIYNEPVFRFFPERWQAEALCKGNVWISTLETCRNYEDPLQGDKKEAVHTYNTGDVYGDTGDPKFDEISARVGVGGFNSRGVRLVNCIGNQYIPDAYVLCTTTEFCPEDLSETFGMHCVKIEDPARLFAQVSVSINKIAKLKESAMGKVEYKSREYTGYQDPPGLLGFVKPSDPYITQKEFRFIWTPQNQNNLKPFLLSCPEVRNLCSIVS